MKVQSTQPVLKQRLQLWILPLALSLGLFSASVSQGQIVGGYTNVFWGTNIWTSGNAALGGTGNWNTAAYYWTTNALGATANSNGPIGGGTFVMTNGPANTSTNNNSGGMIVNFSGTPGSIQQSSAMQVNQVNFLVNGYTWTASGARSLDLTNGIFLTNNVNTIITASSGNSFTFKGTGASGGTGSSLTLGVGNTSGTANYTSAIYFSGGTISVPITMNVGGASNGYAAKFSLGSQNSNGLTINGDITNNSAGPLDLTNSSSGSLVVNGVISGSRGITLGNSSSGKIIVTAANTYSGGTTLLSTSTGEITYSNAAAFGSGSITASGSGTTNYIRALATDLDLANNIAIDANSTLRVGAANTGWKASYSGVISGPGSILYSYSGFMGLSGTNSSFGGGFVLGSSGRADLSKIGIAGQNSSIGTNGVIAAGTITTPSSKPTLRWVGTTNDTSDKVINIGNASGGLELQTLGNGNLTLNGNINSSGLGGPKTIFIYPYTNSSAGTTNTLSLNGVINDGTPGYVVNDATIAASATTITLSSVAGVANGALISGGGCIASGTTIIAVNTTTKVITLSQATTNTANISAGLAVMNVEGATAATALVIQPKSSAGSTFVNVVLGNTANSFSGGVLFTNSQSGLNSILKISKFGNSGENSSLGTASSMTFGGANGSTSTLDYTGNGEVSSKTITLGGSTGTVGLSQSGLGLLKLTGSILPGSTAGSRRLVLSGSSSGTGELASDLGNLSTFTLSIAKSGSGTWTLSGANNTYTGATDIQNGTMIVGATSSLPTASAISVSNGASLRFLKSSSGFNLGAMTVAGNLEQNLITITSSGAVNLAGSTLKVNGTPSLASYTLVTGNSLTGTPTLNPPILGYQLTNNLSGSLLLTISAPSSLSYSDINGTVGTPITSVNPTVTGGAPTEYSISSALPAGLLFSTTTGMISGTPMATAASSNYTVTATNAGGSTTGTVTIAVVPAESSGPTIEEAYPGKDPLAINPDNGLTYLLNYAFGGSDTTAPRLPVMDTSDSTKLTLVAYVRTGGDIQSVVGETASTLPSFDSVNTIPGEVIDPSDAPTGMEKRKYSVMVSGDRKFLRLKVTKR